MSVNAKHILNHIFYQRKRNRAHVNQWSCKGQYLSCRAEHKAQSDRNMSRSMAVYSVVGCGFEASVSAGVQDLQGPDHGPLGCPPEKLLGGKCRHVLVPSNLGKP